MGFNGPENTSRLPSGNSADFMVINRSLGCLMIVAFMVMMYSLHNDQRMHRH